MTVRSAARGALIPAGLAAASAALLAFAFWPERGFVRRVYVDDAGREFACQLFVPHGYDPARRWPAILYLHGAGECGADGERPTRIGLAPAIREREREFPFLAVFPQSAGGVWGADTEDGARAVAILDAVAREFSVDEDRVYLTGYSMGGHGVWSLAAAEPRRWAAVAPVCGWGAAESAASLAKLPSWCFHGADDEVVPAGQSRDTVRAIREAGGRARYTEYPGVGHGAWRQAYGTDELYDWLLSHRRTPGRVSH